MHVKYKATEIAKFFLAKESMSPKKLQKLVYYAYAWYLAFNSEPEFDINERLFEEEVQAWVHGPVIPEIYHKYKENGYHNIRKISPDKVPGFENDTKDLLEQVWEIYGSYNGNELESITHQEEPWKKAREGYGALDRCDEVLDDNLIRDYYLERIVDE